MGALYRAASTYMLSSIFMPFTLCTKGRVDVMTYYAHVPYNAGTPKVCMWYVH